MKTIFFACLFLFSLVMLSIEDIYAQTPQSFKYQAIVRNNTGTVIPDQNVNIRISLLQNSVTGTQVYSEEHAVTTNAFGLVNLEIGNGTNQSGTFATIDWSTGIYFIKIELDINGGSIFSEMGITQLLSVPYALFAGNGDKPVSITGTGAASVTGTYPDFIINSTDTNTTYSAGTGLILTGTTFNSTWTTSGLNIYNNNTGFIGIGTANPTTALHINGTLRITDDSEGLGKVLTSDLFGNASWQTLSAIPTFTGTSDFIPKFTSATSIGNSIVFENGNKIGVGTTTPSGKFEIQAEITSNPEDILFQIKDKNGFPIMQVYQDSIHFYVNDPGDAKTANRGSFAVSGKSQTKALTSNYFHLNTVNLFSGKDAGYKLSSGLNYSGKYNTFLGYEAGYNDTSGYKNYFIGYRAGFSTINGLSNIFVGDSAGFSNTSGKYNINIGNQSAVSNTTGYNNVYMGFETGFSNITGSRNIGIGYQALKANKSDWNVAIGDKALWQNTTGYSNLAIGMNSLYFNTTGYNNSAFGGSALLDNVTGINNTANGFASLNHTTGSWNTSSGAYSLYTNITGNYNSALGYFSFYNGSSYSNSTALGANSVINQSNKVRIGDVNVTVIEGQVAYTFPSDGRFKNNVTEDVKGLDFIVKLRPVVYNFDTEKFDEFLLKELSDSLRKVIINKKDYSKSSSIRQTGLIAQEIEQAANECNFDFNGLHKPENENDNYSVAYSLLTVPLVKAVQELNAKNEELQKRIDALEKIILSK